MLGNKVYVIHMIVKGESNTLLNMRIFLMLTFQIIVFRL